MDVLANFTDPKTVAAWGEAVMTIESNRHDETGASRRVEPFLIGGPSQSNAQARRGSRAGKPMR
ncbi:MAG TPA: hypothetical protein VJ696_10235 [Rhodanobacteraceae bacterium]|nr:hypothetical protein [Rhodanobacteraceae bacterium]